MKWKYILKRLLIAVPTFLGITVLAYFVLNLAPGSPLDALLADPGITPAELERKRIALGLDQPVVIQYIRWLGLLLRGDLGFSYSTQRCRSVDSFVAGCLDSFGYLCGFQAKFQAGLYFRRDFSFDDGYAEFFCGPGIYLCVCHRFKSSSFRRNV